MNSVTIIGSGNVGFHLYSVFTSNKVKVDAIWSRDIENAKAIKSEIATSSLDFSNSKSDIFIICIPDNAVKNVVNNLKTPSNTIITHTSGSTSIEVLNKFDSYGIFYPLQTFSKNKEVDFSTIPILIEANNAETTISLKTLANLISNNVMDCNSEKRKQVHVAAVFACNFANYLLSISEDLLSKEDLDLSLLEPLVKETIKKSFEIGPKNAQTGPAKRKDLDTINKHLNQLSGDNKEVYQLLSDLIIKNY